MWRWIIIHNLDNILNKIEAEHPYKVPGDSSSYNQYNEGWCDCLDRVRLELKDVNDGWIPVDERMPTQEECKDNLFWITYGSFSSSSRIAKCQWIFSYDENGNDDSYSEFWIDQSPCIYTPSQNLVKAWKIMDIPEPYRPEKE